MELDGVNSRFFSFLLVYGMAIIFMAILIIFLGMNAQAADIYVDDDNTAGPWDGSTTNPYQNITSAIDNSNPTDTIYVWNGTYNENITVDKELSIVGNSSTNTTIDGFGTNNNIINITAEGVEITGFNITESGAWYGIWANVGGLNIHDNIMICQSDAIHINITDMAGNLNGFSVASIGEITIESNEIYSLTDGIQINIQNIGYNLSDDAQVQLGALNIIWNTIDAYRGINITNIKYLGFNMSGNAAFTWGGLYVDDNIINVSEDGIYQSGGIWPDISTMGYWGYWLNDSASFTMGGVSFSRNDIVAGNDGIYLNWIKYWGDYMTGTSSFSMGDVLFNDNIINSTENGLSIRELAHFGYYMYGDSTFEMGDIELDRNEISTYQWNPMNLDDFDEWGQYMYGNSSYRMGNVSFDDNILNAGWGGGGGNGINHGEFNIHGEYMYDYASFVMGDVSMDRNTVVNASGNGFWLDDFDHWGHYMHGNCTFIMGSVTVNDNVINAMDRGIYQGELERHGYHMYINSSYTMGNIEFCRNVVVIDNPNGGFGFAFSEFEEWGKDLTGTSSYTMGHVLIEDNQVWSTGHGIDLQHSIGEWGNYVRDDSHVIIGDFILRNNTVEALQGALNFTIDMVGYNVHEDSTVTVGTFLIVDNVLKGSRGIDIEEIIEFGYNNSGNSVFTWGGLYVDDNIINATQHGIIQEWGSYIGYWGMWLNDSASFDMGDVSFCRNDIVSAGRGLQLYDLRNWGSFMNGTSSFSMGDVLFNDNTINSTDQGLTVYDLSHFGFHMDGDSTFEMGEIELDRNNVTTYDGSAMNLDDFDEWGQYMYGHSSYRMGNVSIDDNTLNGGWGGFGGYGLYQGELNIHGEYMYDYASFVMGDISIDRNTVVNSSSSGFWLDDFDHWGHYMYGNCTFVMGSVTVNDNVINAMDRGIYQGELERHGYHMYINSSYTMGNIEFCRNVVVIDNPNGGFGFAFSEFEEWGKDLTGTSSYTMGHVLIEDNQVWSTGHGIDLQHSIGEWGNYVRDDSHVIIGDFILRNNTVDAVHGALNFTIDQVGYNVHDDSTVTVGTFLIVENVLKGSRGIDIEEIAEFGYNNSGNSVFTWGGLYVEDNVINATQDGILQNIDSGSPWNRMGYWGVWLNDSASVAIGDVSFSRNTIDAGESGLKLWFFDYWGSQMYGSSSFTVGDLLIVDNVISALNDDGMAIREVAHLGAYMHDDSTWVGGNIELCRNTIEAGDDGMWNDDFDEWGWYMYGNASFHLGHVRLDDNVINATDDGISFPNMMHHGYRMYNNASFEMGDYSFDRNTINVANGDGMYLRYLEDWGHHMWGSCTFVMGSFTVNDNIIEAAETGIELGWLEEHGYNMSVASSYAMGNVEFCRNYIVIVGLNPWDSGIDVSLLENWGQYLTGTSSYTMGHILFEDNQVWSTGHGIELGSNIGEWGKYVYDNSHVIVGDLILRNNTVDAFHGALNFTIDQVGYNVHGDSTVTVGTFLIVDNVLKGSRGIDIEEIAEFGYNNSGNSVFTWGGLYVEDNVINATQDGILQNIDSGSPWNRMGYWGVWLNDSASVAIGDVSFSRNTIDAGESGLKLWFFDYWGSQMYGSSSFTVGDLLIVDNVISATNQDGMAIREVGHLGTYMHEDSTWVGGNIELCRNTIEAGDDGMWNDDFDEWGWYMYGNASFHLGHVRLDDNVINATDDGISFPNMMHHGYRMYNNASFEMGDFSFDRNIINATVRDGMYLNYIEDWGYHMWGTCTFIMGSFTVNDNVIMAGEDGIELDWFEEHGYNMSVASTYTMGNVEFCRNTITSGRDGMTLDKFREWGTQMSGASTYFMGDILVRDNMIDCNRHGILLNEWHGWWGYDVQDSSHVNIGNFDIVNNTVEAGAGAINFSIEKVGYDVHGDSTVTVGAFMIVDNILNGSRGIDIQKIMDFGYNNSGNSIFTWGGLYVDDNVITATKDGIYQSGGVIGYWGYWLNDSASFTMNDVSFSRNDVVTTNYGIYIWLQSWASNLGDNSTLLIGNWILNDNTIQAGDSGLYFYPESFGRDNGDYSTATIGNCEIIGNTINSSGEYGIYSGWWYYFAHTLSGSANVEIGGSHVVNNNVWMGNASGVAIYCHPYQTGYEVNYDSQVTLGDYIVTDNVVYSTYNGIWIQYEWVGMFVGVTGSPDSQARVDIGNLLINDNIITAPNYRGLTLNYELVAAYTDLNSTVMAGMIQIYNNTIDSYEEAMYVQLAWLGDNMWGASQGSVGRCEIDDNNLNSQNSTGIYVRVYRCAFTMRENSEFYWEGIYIMNNDITAQGVGIDVWFDDCVDLTGNSIVGFPMLWVTGNTVDSALSAFNLTTITTPIELAPTAELNWGDVFIENNVFDGGLFGMAMNWIHPNASIGQPVFFINNCNIFGGTAGSTGLFLFNITDVWAERVTIDTFDYGIYSNNSIVHYMINSSVANCVVFDISLYSDSYLFMINSTFDNSSLDFEDYSSLLDVAWFMNVLVQSQVALPVPEANVTVADGDGTEIFNGTADLDGRVFYLICMDYQQNKTGIIKNYNDYTADGNKGGSFGSAIPNPTMNQTRLVVITLIDNIPPTIFGDNSDTAGTTGDPFYFEINASDNMGIVSVRVNFRYNGIGFYTNLTMNGTGPYWLYEGLPTDVTGFIEYYFSALDSGGFWVNTTPTTAPITDNDAPTIISDDSDTQATTGDTFNFIVDAVDNINISEVHVVWWFGAGVPINNTLSGPGPYMFSISVPSDSLDQFHYYFTIVDTAGNWLVGPQIDIDVTDNNDPTYGWVLRPTLGFEGSSVNVSLTATDNIGIVNYTITVNGTTYDLIKDGDYYNYTIDIPFGSTEDITYNVTFLDSAGNSITTPDTMIAISGADLEPPQLIWVSQPMSGTTGEPALVSLLVTDNVGVTYYKISIDGVLYDLAKDGDYYNYTILIPSDSTTDITYYVIFNDTANNPISSTPDIISVTDNDAPTYLWNLHPTEANTGDSVLVSVEASDNIGISLYQINIDGTTFDMTKDGNFYNYTINVPSDSTASITYNITFEDAAGNSLTLSDTVIAITAPDNEAPSYTWVLHPSTGTTDDPAYVSILATDNVEITYYKISIDGTLYDLTKDGDHYNYTINVPSGSTTSITYFIVLNDAANNENTIPDTTITVTDNDAPTDLADTSDTEATTGDAFTFEVDASDNIGLDEVHVVYWFGDGTPTNATMTGTGPYTLDITIPSDSTDTLHYYFTLSDAAGNWLVGSQVDISVIDNDDASIVNDASDSSGKDGKAFRFQIEASDNTGISQVRAVYWFGDDDSQKQYLNLSTADGTYSGSFTPQESGTLYYYFEVTDSAANVFESTENSVVIDVAEEEDEEEFNALPFLLIVVLVIVVLLFFILSRRGKEGEEVPEEGGEEETPEEEKGEEVPEEGEEIAGLEGEEELEGEEPLEEGESGSEEQEGLDDEDSISGGELEEAESELEDTESGDDINLEEDAEERKL